MKIIKIDVPEEILMRASERAARMGVIANSITGGEGNLAGFVAEETLVQLIPDAFLIDGNPNFDIVIGNDLTFDVKTKRTTVIPRANYECSIATTSLHQNCDGDVFCRYVVNSNCLYLCGWIGQQAYFDSSKFLKKGDVVDNNNFTVKQDCYNLPIGSLSEMSLMQPFNTSTFSLEFLDI